MLVLLLNPACSLRLSCEDPVLVTPIKVYLKFASIDGADAAQMAVAMSPKSARRKLFKRVESRDAEAKEAGREPRSEFLVEKTLNACCWDM